MDRPRRPAAPRLIAAVVALAVGTSVSAAGAAAQSPPAADPGPAGDGAAATLPDAGAGPAEGPDGARGRIDGFWGVRWGADSAAVASRLGTPITVGDGGDRLRYFVYTPLYLARDGFLQMWLHEEEGLVGGSWEPMISDCGGMLRRLVQATRQVHPAVPVRTEGGVTPEMLGGDLCLAALEKGASVTVVWEDEAGTEIRLGTTPGSHRLRMRAVTGALRERRPGGV